MTDFINLQDDLDTAAIKPGTLTRPYIETCKVCRGTGKFRSYTGRLVGECFKCRGAGSIAYRTSPEARAKTKQRTADKKRAEGKRIAEAVLDWKEGNAGRWTWLCERNGTFDFATSLMQSLCKYGSLTPGQVAAIDKCMLRDSERAAEHAKQQEEAKAAGFDLSNVPSGRYIINQGDEAVHVKINNVQKGRWEGWVFVETTPGKERLGRQGPNQAYIGKYAKELSDLAGNPLEAAKEYGRVTGSCCICGRVLTNHESIEAGIGPICAGRF